MLRTGGFVSLEPIRSRRLSRQKMWHVGPVEFVRGRCNQHTETRFYPRILVDRVEVETRIFSKAEGPLKLIYKDYEIFALYLLTAKLRLKSFMYGQFSQKLTLCAHNVDTMYTCVYATSYLVTVG
jgi:hypothetical protein